MENQILKTCRAITTAINESEQPPQDGGTIISDQEASELAATSNVEVIWYKQFNH